MPLLASHITHQNIKSALNSGLKTTLIYSWSYTSKSSSMAISKAVIFSLLVVSLLVLNLVEADETVNVPQSTSVTGKIDCGGDCAARCRLSSRPRLCNRACVTCCQRCNCVPPGTAGNQEVCPCYANMTTHGGRRKCP